MYIHIYIYIHTRISLYMYMYISIYIHIYIYIYILCAAPGGIKIEKVYEFYEPKKHAATTRRLACDSNDSNDVAMYM